VSGTPFHVEVLRDLGVGVAHGKQKVVLAKYYKENEFGLFLFSVFVFVCFLTLKCLESSALASR
jgi:hypothetical protein